MSMDELRKELAELEAKKAERAAARAEKDALAQMRAEVARAKQELEDAEVIDRFEDELGERGVHWEGVSTPAGIVIVKRPHAATFKRFRDLGKYTSKALEDLVRPCVAHPDAQGLTDLLADYPAVLDELADAVTELAGVKRKQTEEK